MSDETGVKSENAKNGDNVAKETDTRTDSDAKETKETKPRSVSFNRDVHVKRFGESVNEVNFGTILKSLAMKINACSLRLVS